MNYLNYVLGTGYILKDKLLNYEKEPYSITRIFPKKSLLEQYSYFYWEPNQILPNLYLGSAFNAYYKPHLLSKSITVILNITQEISNYYQHDDSNIKYYKYPIQDNNKDNITLILHQASDIIDYHLSRGDTILVHCYMGASRSASVVIYYLMKYKQFSFIRAIRYVKEHRPIINLTTLFLNTIRNQRMITNS